MNTRSALTVLEDALHRCAEEDMRTTDVRLALDELRARVTEVLPYFAQFECALATENPDGRWQLANAALNGIKLRLVAN